MYSKAASVIRGHHDKSKDRSFCKFSAINSTPSSVILLQPDKLSTVRLGKECTRNKNNCVNLEKYSGVARNITYYVFLKDKSPHLATLQIRILLTYVYDAVIGELPARVQPQNVERIALFRRKISQSCIGNVIGLQRKLVQSR